jgi:hypothetical protein
MFVPLHHIIERTGEWNSVLHLRQGRAGLGRVRLWGLRPGRQGGWGYNAELEEEAGDIAGRGMVAKSEQDPKGHPIT